MVESVSYSGIGTARAAGSRWCQGNFIQVLPRSLSDFIRTGVTHRPGRVTFKKLQVPKDVGIRPPQGFLLLTKCLLGRLCPKLEEFSDLAVCGRCPIRLYLIAISWQPSLT